MSANIAVFQRFDTNGDFWIYRLRVPGGWLVVVDLNRTDYNTNDGRGTKFRSVGTTFVPDSGHTWVIGDIGDNS